MLMHLVLYQIFVQLFIICRFVSLTDIGTRISIVGPMHVGIAQKKKKKSLITIILYYLTRHCHVFFRQCILIEKKSNLTTYDQICRFRNV